jgi:hypothetical protein
VPPVGTFLPDQSLARHVISFRNSFSSGGFHGSARRSASSLPKFSALFRTGRFGSSPGQMILSTHQLCNYGRFAGIC